MMLVEANVNLFMLSVVFITMSQCIFPTEGQLCPPVPCGRDTLRCNYQTYFAMPPGITCRGCNTCLKPGLPEDSNGCPLMECKGPLAAAMCRDPRYANSWLDYGGRKCPTCTTMLCKMRSS